MMRVKLFFLLVLALTAGSLDSQAQLSFPNGKSVDLVTGNDYLYFETRLIFNTGKRKAEQYRYEKISDSVDSRWFVSSCMNGDCVNLLPDSGNFIGVYGLNDSTCYIAFHVETYGHDGKSVIRYRVTNKFDTTEKADLTFSITYTGPSGIRHDLDAGNGFSLFPNPANSAFSLMLPEGPVPYPVNLDILSMAGQVVLRQEIAGSARNRIDVSGLREGIYFVRIPAPGRYVYKPLTILR